MVGGVNSERRPAGMDERHLLSATDKRGSDFDDKLLPGDHCGTESAGVESAYHSLPNKPTNLLIGAFHGGYAQFVCSVRSVRC